MELAVALATPGQAETAENIGSVYVTQIGDAANFWKIGKAKNYEERLKAHRTMSVERLSLYAEIETEDYGKIETYLKHLLQGHRWTEGEGREIYQAERAVIDEAVASARSRAAFMPRIAEAAALKERASEETVLMPTEAMTTLHKKRLQVKATEWAAKHEGEQIDAEIQLVMGTAAELAGVAIWRSGETRDFDEGRFGREHPELYERYNVTKPTRNFNIRW
jgi:T5orf172 domain